MWSLEDGKRREDEDHEKLNKEEQTPIYEDIRIVDFL